MRRRWKRRSGIFGSLFAALVMVLGPGAGSAPAGGVIVVGENDARSTVEIVCGERLQVVLNANPTTGYQWAVEAVDPNVLKTVGEGFYPPDSRLVGAGGKAEWSFDALSPGRTTLKLIYRRPFEKDVPPVKTFERTVVVKPSP